MERFNGRAWLAELGYPNIEENPMGEKIEQWWAWYTATAPFYGSDTTINGRHFKVKRISIRPAKMVCEDWASLLFNERTEIGLEGSSEQEGASLQAANDWLEGWLADHDFMRVASRTTERAFALGTAGWALSVDGLNVDGTRSDGAEIIPERYDARQIIPLAYTGERCTECLFTSKVLIAGKRYNQLVVHRLTPDGSYEICTAHFNDAGKRVVFDNFVERFDTRQTTPTFALIRPGIDNCHLEYHPFGVSVFDQALGAVEMCDMAVDNLNRDLYLGQKMMFIPSAMLEKDARGNTVVPRAADQQLFAAFEDAGYIDGRAQGPYEYNPDLRVEDNRLAIKTALELLGKRCGFGKDYYSLDDRGGGAARNRTATEVASDAAELMRNVRKHEEAITPGVVSICEAALTLASNLMGLGFPDVRGRVAIVYGDSIIEDDAAIRIRDREDVAASLMPGWRYIEKWQAVDEATAREWWAEAATPVAEA